LELQRTTELLNDLKLPFCRQEVSLTDQLLVRFGEIGGIGLNQSLGRINPSPQRSKTRAANGKTLGNQPRTNDSMAIYGEL
jgi:hypothetical protein